MCFSYLVFFRNLQRALTLTHIKTKVDNKVERVCAVVCMSLQANMFLLWWPPSSLTEKLRDDNKI